MRDLSLHILDIAQNAIAANGRNIRIAINTVSVKGKYIISIEDDGRGMSADELSKISDPFYTTRTTRKVGMGLPLFKQNAELTGGGLQVRSQLGKGTIVEAHFYNNHIDMKPEGDIGQTISSLIYCNPQLDFYFSYTGSNGTFEMGTHEIREAMDGIPLNTPGLLSVIAEMVNANIAEVT